MYKVEGRGEGGMVSLWYDDWTKGGTLGAQFPHICAFAKNKDAFIKDSSRGNKENESSS